LTVGDAEGSARGELLGRLDSLGRNREAERRCEGNDRSHDLECLGLLRHFGNETAIDFDRFDREAAQITQR